MSSVTRPGYRKAGKNRAVLMRTAATALIAVSPFLYSGASAATTSDPIHLAAPALTGGKIAERAQAYSIASTAATLGTFRLDAPFLKVGNESFLAIDFNLTAPTLQGTRAASGPHAATQPVQNLLAVPMEAKAAQAGIGSTTFAITPAPATTTVDNSDDLTVSDSETAIDVDADPNHVVINNSGDLAGAGGISVVTGKLVDDDSQVTSSVYEWTTYYNVPRYDDLGNPIDTVTKTVRDNSVITRDLNANQSDAAITIDNSGSIDFSGLYGIKALNPAGASIDIINSGDITATSDTPRRVGIYANTKADYYSSAYDGPNVISPGEYTYNADGDLTGVITPGQQEATTTRTRMTNDIGSISIVNNGAIDMGEVVLEEFPFGPASEGITAYGYGGIEIINNGSIKVGDGSVGI